MPLKKQGMDAADKIITVSNLTRKIVIEKYGVNPEKVHSVYNAVEPYLYGGDKTSLVKGFDEKDCDFFWVGSPCRKDLNILWKQPAVSSENETMCVL